MRALLLCLGLLGLAKAQTHYDEALGEMLRPAQSQQEILDLIETTDNNVFLLLPVLNNAVLSATLTQLVRAEKTVYIIMPESQKNGTSQSLLRAGLKIKTVPGDFPEPLLVIDYLTLVRGQMIVGQRGATDIIDMTYMGDSFVSQLRLAWQTAHDY